MGSPVKTDFYITRVEFTSVYTEAGETFSTALTRYMFVSAVLSAVTDHTRRLSDSDTSNWAGTHRVIPPSQSLESALCL